MTKEELKKSFIKYAQHRTDCESKRPPKLPRDPWGDWDYYPCDCGLDEFLEAVK